MDLLFVLTFQWGIAGAAIATVIAQYVSGLGILIYFLRKGIRSALLITSIFSILISFLVVTNAEGLMKIFISAEEVEVIASGVRYLQVEGAFYIGIGILFLLYGFYRAVNHPGISVVLTIISLGLRVALAYALAPIWGEVGIWAAIPIGWLVADAAGFIYYRRHRASLLTLDASFEA